MKRRNYSKLESSSKAAFLVLRGKYVLAVFSFCLYRVVGSFQEFASVLFTFCLDDIAYKNITCGNFEASSSILSRTLFKNF